MTDRPITGRSISINGLGAAIAKWLGVVAVIAGMMATILGMWADQRYTSKGETKRMQSDNLAHDIWARDKMHEMDKKIDRMLIILEERKGK